MLNVTVGVTSTAAWTQSVNAIFSHAFWVQYSQRVIHGATSMTTIQLQRPQNAGSLLLTYWYAAVEIAPKVSFMPSPHPPQRTAQRRSLPT